MQVSTCTRLLALIVAAPLLFPWNALCQDGVEVVLQEAGFEPIPSNLTRDANSDPPAFFSAVRTIEQGVHVAAPDAAVYLYSTWAPADTAYLDATANGMDFSADRFLASLANLTLASHAAYVKVAEQDGRIRSIAPVGDAWARAWLEGVANPDPYAGSAPAVRCKEQPERILTLSLLIEGTNNLAEVVNRIVGGFRACTGIQ